MAKRKAVLAIGDAQTYGYQHDAVSRALAEVERLGRESGLFDTWIRTDVQLATKQVLSVRYGKERNMRNLNDFDAVFMYTAGDPQMSDQQKADFLSFLRDDGKGLVGAHSAVTTFYSWPTFGEVIGAYFDHHPWEIRETRVIVEDQQFPAMRQFSPDFSVRDEVYQMRAPYSRTRVHVLARLDTSGVDFDDGKPYRPDRDYPLAWIRSEGKGRVFYSTFGHTQEAWDHPAIQTMYLEALKWAMRATT